MRFRIVLVALAALFLGYSVFWYMSADNARTNIAKWIAEQKAAGADISYSELEVGGYPYRIEVAVKDVLYRGQEGQVGWTLKSPSLVFTATLWKLEHKIFFADDVLLTYADPASVTENRIQAEGLRASLVTDAADNPLRFSFASKTLTMVDAMATPENAAGADVTIPRGTEFQDLEMHWRAASEAVREKGQAADETGIKEPVAWQLATKAQNIRAESFKDSPYGPEMKSFELLFEMRGAGIGFDGNPQTVAAWRDRGGTLELTSGKVLWGEFDADLEGSVTLDQQFRPLGAFTALVQGYEPLLDQILKSGGIENQDAKTVKGMLDQIVASDNDNDGRLKLPLAMQGGYLMLGPLPLAELKPVIEAGK